MIIFVREASMHRRDMQPTASLSSNQHATVILTLLDTAADMKNELLVLRRDLWNAVGYRGPPPCVALLLPLFIPKFTSPLWTLLISAPLVPTPARLFPPTPSTGTSVQMVTQTQMQIRFVVETTGPRLLGGSNSWG